MAASATPVLDAGLVAWEQIVRDVGDAGIMVELLDVAGEIVAANRPPVRWVPRDVTTYAEPVVDPANGQLLGRVRVICRATDAGVFARAYARLAARTVAAQLAGHAAVDHAVQEAFRSARKKARGAVLALSDRSLLTNAAADRLVQAGDHAGIWSWARSALRREGSGVSTLPLLSEPLDARCSPIHVGGELVGAIVHLEPQTRADPGGRRGDRTTFGWTSLRPSELGIAELVADGLTNREVAARLFLSPHTVDFHLRQIYRKLSITSRTELTRLVVEHSGSATSRDDRRYPLAS
jgi:DNA-binding CsgD family transcriptional regulator